jgi:hypothetical protein
MTDAEWTAWELKVGIRGPKADAAAERHKAWRAEVEAEEQAERDRSEAEATDGAKAMVGIEGSIDDALVVMCGLEGGVAQGFKMAIEQGMITEEEAYDRAFELATSDDKRGWT